MKRMFLLINDILSGVDKDTLIKKIPLFEESVEELFISIKEAPTFEMADRFFDLLLMATGPLSLLLFKYQVQLPKRLDELVRNYERLDDYDLRKYIYKNIKQGNFLEDNS